MRLHWELWRLGSEAVGSGQQPRVHDLQQALGVIHYYRYVRTLKRTSRTHAMERANKDGVQTSNTTGTDAPRLALLI